MAVAQQMRRFPIEFLCENDLTVSCLLVIFIFFTLLLFPINIWIFELKRTLSISIGWSYFIGWVVFVLYVTCSKWPGGPWERGDMGGLGQRKCRERGLAVHRDRFLGTYLPFDLTLLATFFPLSGFPLLSTYSFPAFLCYFDHKHFWSLILSHLSSTVPCISSSRSGSLNDQIVSNASVNQEEVLDLE